MGRTKGSRNRTTLVKRLTKHGAAVPDLAKLSHVELEQRLAQAVAAAPPPPVVVEKTFIDPEVAKAIIEQARTKFDEMVDYYAPGKLDLRGHPVLIPDRVQDAVRRVFHAESTDQAHYLAKRAIDKLFLHMLAEWTKRRISGPNTPENIAARSKDADSWANRLEKEGRPEEAERQRARAEAIRVQPPRLTPFHLWVV